MPGYENKNFSKPTYPIWGREMLLAQDAREMDLLSRVPTPFEALTTFTPFLIPHAFFDHNQMRQIPREEYTGERSISMVVELVRHLDTIADTNSHPGVKQLDALVWLLSDHELAEVYQRVPREILPEWNRWQRTPRPCGCLGLAPVPGCEADHT